MEVVVFKVSYNRFEERRRMLLPRFVAEAVSAFYRFFGFDVLIRKERKTENNK